MVLYKLLPLIVNTFLSYSYNIMSLVQPSKGSKEIYDYKNVV